MNQPSVCHLKVGFIFSYIPIYTCWVIVFYMLTFNRGTYIKKELMAYLISLRATLSLLSISRVVLPFYIFIISFSLAPSHCTHHGHILLVIKSFVNETFIIKSYNRTTEKGVDKSWGLVSWPSFPTHLRHKKNNNGVFLSQSTNLQSRVIWQNQSCSHSIIKVKSWQKHALDILLPGQVMTRGPSTS